jgi:hypothetical protein
MVQHGIAAGAELAWAMLVFSNVQTLVRVCSMLYRAGEQ